MSDEENGGFLSRWSRRKAASRVVAPPEPPPEPVPELPSPDLPPIESLGSDSDYTVFLARGVPRLLQAQALRVAWASDPAIADFRGMAEYAWDFNAPGYGDLAAGDDAAQWLGQIVRSGGKLLAGSVAAPTEAVVEPPVVQAEPSPVLPAPVADAAPVVESQVVDSPVVLRRRHGGAVPI